MPSWKRLARRAGATLCGAALALVFLEGGLRVAGLLIASRDRSSLDPDAGGEGVRVLCLGACYTLGVGVEPTESWPAQLERKLTERYPGRGFDVTNGGVRSKGLDYFAERIDTLLDAHQPDILVVNVNDRILYRVAAERRASALPVWLRGSLASARVFRLGRLLEAAPEPLEIEPDTEVTLGADSGRRARLLESTRLHPDDGASWLELARLYDAHGEWTLALGALDGAERAGAGGEELVRFRARMSAFSGRYAAAATALESLRSRWEEDGYALRRAHAAELLARLRVAPVAEIVPVGMETMDAYAELGDWGVAESVADDLLGRVPGTAEAYDYRSFFRAMQQGDPASAPDLDAFFEKRVSTPRSAGAFGLYARDARSADANAALFWEVLDANLGAIVRAARARGTRVIVEDLSSMPAQRAILAAEASMLDIPYLHLHNALADAPDRAALMHPQQHLRLSVRGNEVVAEAILAGLEQEGLLE